MLSKGLISTPLEKFIKKANKSKQLNSAASIKEFSNELEDIIFNAIKKATITLPPGTVIVAGSATTQTNAQPIVANGSIS